MSQLFTTSTAELGTHASGDITEGVVVVDQPKAIEGFFDHHFDLSRSDSKQDDEEEEDDDKMLESPIARARTPVTPSGPAIARPAMHRTKSNSLSQRRPELRLQLTPDEQIAFNAAIETARKHLVSDALKLPASTNMGLGKNGPPAKVMTSGTSDGNEERRPAGPNNVNTMQPSAQASTMKRAPSMNAWPIPQPIAEKERTQIPSEHQLTIKAHEEQAHGWEEAETFVKRSASSGTSASPETGKAVYLRAIPCMYAANVVNATSFYRDILGFSLLGKPDSSHASLFRSPTNGKPSAATVPGSRTHSRNLAKQAPSDSVQIYIRIVPMGPDGQRVKPPPTTLWILANDVDAVYEEIQAKWQHFLPRTDEYFPMHTFGDAKILAKPQNKAWGNRELHVVDGDGNKIIFFRETL